MNGNRIKRKWKPIELKRIEINSVEKKPIAKKCKLIKKQKNNQRKEMKPIEKRIETDRITNRNESNKQTNRNH